MTFIKKYVIIKESNIKNAAEAFNKKISRMRKARLVLLEAGIGTFLILSTGKAKKVKNKANETRKNFS